MRIDKTNRVQEILCNSFQTSFSSGGFEGEVEIRVGTHFGAFVGAPDAEIDLSLMLGWYVLRPTGGNIDTSEARFELDFTAARPNFGKRQDELALEWYNQALNCLQGAVFESDYEFLYDYNPDGSVRAATVRSRFTF